MTDIIEVAKDCGAVAVRRQILVVKTNPFMKPQERDVIRETIMEQMKDGVVVLPNYCEALVCDADTLVVMRGGDDEQMD